MAKIIMAEEASAPATPSTGEWLAYFKADGLFIKDDAGNESGPIEIGINPNVLPNGGFRIAQRGAGPFTSATPFVNNDDAYLLDGCIFLANGSDTCDVSQVADLDFVSGSKIRLDVETANRRFGILLPVENRDIQDIRKSGFASLQFKIKCTGTSVSNVRAYLLAWDGTADVITSDVISAWGSAGADPTFVSNWTVENTPANIPITTSIALQTIENIAVDTAGVKNLAVLIIIDDTDATVGDFIDIGDIKLENGSSCTPFVNKEFHTQLSHCKRYLNVWDQSAAANIIHSLALRVTTNAVDLPFVFPVEMRVAPSLQSAGSLAWAAGAPSGNQIAFFNLASGAYTTISGALSILLTGQTKQGAYFRCSAGTSFNGTAGNVGNFYLGNAAGIAISAEL